MLHGYLSIMWLQIIKETSECRAVDCCSYPIWLLIRTRTGTYGLSWCLCCSESAKVQRGGGREDRTATKAHVMHLIFDGWLYFFFYESNGGEGRWQKEDLGGAELEPPFSEHQHLVLTSKFKFGKGSLGM